MIQETKQMIGLLLKNDPTVLPEVREAVLRLLDGKSNVGLTDSRPLDRVLSRPEVARLLGVAPRTVSYYAKRGTIRPVRLGTGRKRAVGYSEASVRRALEGIINGTAPDIM